MATRRCTNRQQLNAPDEPVIPITWQRDANVPLLMSLPHGYEPWSNAMNVEQTFDNEQYAWKMPEKYCSPLWKGDSDIPSSGKNGFSLPLGQAGIELKKFSAQVRLSGREEDGGATTIDNLRRTTVEQTEEFGGAVAVEITPWN